MSAVLDKDLQSKVNLLNKINQMEKDGVITPSRMYDLTVEDPPNKESFLNDVVNITDKFVSDSLAGAVNFVEGGAKKGGELASSLLDYAVTNPDTFAAGVGGKILTTAAIGNIIKNLPEASSARAGLGKMYADYALNYLDGFYAKGANKNKLYLQEFAKTTGRLAKDFVSPKSLIAYKNTGISPLVSNLVDNLGQDLNIVEQKYLEGHYGQTGETAIEKALRDKKKHIKIRHYKILNDAANRQIFSSKKSNILEKYRMNNGKPWFTASNQKEFLKLVGSKAKAEYLMQVHTIGHQNLPGYGKIHKGIFGDKRLGFGANTEFVKWNDTSISGITRGAQFHKPAYFALEDLKNSKNVKTVQDARVLLSKHGFKSTVIKDKVLFNFSPSIKSNFDWGGYNAVAEWDIKNRGRVTLTGTDLRDTPVSSTLKGKNVINYVEAKDVKIADLKEEAGIPKKTTRGKDIGKRKTRVPKQADYDIRLKNITEGKLQVGEKGIYKNILGNIDEVGKGRARYLTGITSKNAYKIAQKQFMKSRVGLMAGVGLSAYALLSGAKDLFGEDEEELVDPFKM